MFKNRLGTVNGHSPQELKVVGSNPGTPCPLDWLDVKKE